MPFKFSERDLLLHYPFSNSRRKVLIDVGACVGAFSLPFAKRGWEVITFEPEENNFRQMKSRLEQFERVTCLQKVVSNIDKQHVTLYTSRDHPGIHSLKPFHKTHTESVQIESVCLSSALNEHEIRNVNLLKIDTEGADFLVIKGFDFSYIRPEIVMCEFMDSRSRKHYGYSHHDIVSYMRRFGYVCFVSEWAPIVEYARKDVPITHRFLCCARYPLDHDPDGWGNLIFILKSKESTFQNTLSRYLIIARLTPIYNQMLTYFSSTPIGKAYSWIKSSL